MAPLRQLVTITTDGTRFQPARSTVANGPFRLAFVNDAPGARHGVEIVDAQGEVVASIGPIEATGRMSTPLDGLPAGIYTLVDPADRSITARLTVE